MSPLFESTLMTRGSFGAVHLAAARPNFINPTDRSHPIGESPTITYINIYICIYISLVERVYEGSRFIFLFVAFSLLSTGALVCVCVVCVCVWCVCVWCA